ncbi:hypothetical protein GQ55_3G277400 [Panicum hallii var. hallii]|uniref:Uncharacterized protein n=1 Tax=Panicum hallii var. hallii TaxID=1504633 RepID=A0A2T7EE39_9POAL|nr:hypothetical protein GQ55_3G277400 [Panicum hallii var. hallii]PUZ66071.1 hypothetical protein GQ55_3G277400 [Panicum hallii var. hallii]PUZ66072.1 hypothetical protein GQ55_3G277400 [Panicum hallii var. hallii]
MAFQTPTAVLLNENMQMIQKGKRADAPSTKPLKPSTKPGLQERKALQDVSNIPKGTALSNRSSVKERSILKDKSTMKERSILKERPGLHNVSNTLRERSILKEKSDLRSHQAINNPVNIFADEETKKCHEWAKHGVEGIHFTGNDSQKLDKDVQDKRVKKKVAKVMSALHGWSDVVVDPVMFPATEVANFPEEVKELELEPEILPNNIRYLATSGNRADAPRAKPLKPSVKPSRQERKALQDLSNTLSERKGLQDMFNTVKEESILKESSALCSHEVTKNPLKIFTVEETRKYHEWAKDVIEGSHFTGNDPQKLDKDVQEERDKAQLAEGSSTDDELDEYPFLDNNPIKFELRDEPGIPDLRAN